MHFLMQDWHDGRCYEVVFLMWNCSRMKCFSESHDHISPLAMCSQQSVPCLLGWQSKQGWANVPALWGIFHSQNCLIIFFVWKFIESSIFLWIPTAVVRRRWGGKSEREECKYMVLASAYSPTLQIRLNCCVLVPIHWLWGAVATQPSVALAIRPFLGWQDGAGCQILVTVLDTLSQIQAARQAFRLYCQNLCYLGGTN